MKKFKILALAAIFFVGTAATTLNNNKLFEISKNIEIFTNLYKEINTHYVDEIDPSQLMKTGIDAMLESLDPYTKYYSETQIESFRFMTEGKYNGLGARIRSIDDYPTIIEMYEGSPALKSGLHVGDQIISIGGKSAEGKNNEEVTAILRGVPGTKVDVVIRRYGMGAEESIELERGEISIPNVPYSGMLDEETGYVILTTFTRDASRNIKSAIEKLKKENAGMKSLVFDLRDNGGGLLREAVNISNLFIPKNEEIVSTKGKVRERDQVFKTLNAPLDLDIPLVVMINKNTASASEIVSGVLQDLDRGIVMGQRSYGKGLVQNTRDVGYNSQVKMTTSKYYIPSGRCIQSVEYENGEPVDVPDDQRTAFTTRNNRKVLDGGGITPDINIEIKRQPTLVRELLRNNQIFKFVNQFVQKNESIADPAVFTFTDYAGFKSYLAANNFVYKSDSERALEKLKEMAEDETMMDQLASEISSMEKKIQTEKSTELDKYKDQIIERIENEIVSRYYFQNGKIQHKLKNDQELQEAIALLKDQAKYKSILK